MKTDTEIQFEKLLCAALGKPWTEALSLESLSKDILTVRQSLELIVRGRCGACKRMNTVSGCTISDGEGGPRCGNGKRCYHELVNAEQVARFALETIGVSDYVPT